MRSRLLCLLPLLLLPSLAAAFASSAAGNVTTYSGFTAGPSNIAKYAVSAASDGTILVNSGGRMNVPGGGTIPISVTGSVPRPTAAAAIGRFLARGVPLVATAAALYALADELGFIFGSDGGQLVITKPLDGFDGRMYRQQSSTHPWQYTVKAACDYIGGILGSPMYIVPNYPSAGPYNFGCHRTNGTGSIYTLSSMIAPNPPANVPSSVAEFENAIATKSGWPSDTTLGNAIRDVVAAGETVPVASPVVTGPALSPGTSSVTVNQTTGETTTVTQTISNVYNGPNVTTTVITDTVVTDTATGAPISQSTTTQTPVVPQQPATEEPQKLELPCGIAGLPPCNVKVDEEGTPDELAEDKFKPMLDEGKQAQEDLLEQVKGDADKSFFDGFADLFVTPPLAECVPLEIPGDRG
ncbi:hypothetical protein, partial [Hydrogenophaga sp.]|uniref:hypothetical protein n=1 Tax=Hydrogenophaga sp. TaxID=1904254 RepID=UPI002736D465